MDGGIPANPTEQFKESIWGLILEIKTELIKAATPVLQSVGLSEQQTFVIMSIKDKDSYTVSKLAEQLHTNQGNFSSACKKMEQLGLISRKRSREDERVVTLELTELGENKVRELYCKLDEMFERARATPEQLERIACGCTETVKLLREINGKHGKQLGESEC